MTPTTNSRVLLGLLPRISVIGAAVLLVGVAISPDRIWSNLLVASFYLVTLALGGALFIALGYICGASWNVAFRRVPEAMANMLPVACVGLLAVLLIGMKAYAWHYDGEEVGTFWFKESWSSPAFWAVRAVVYMVLWVLLSRAIVAVSRRQDHSPDVGLTILNKRLSAVFLVVFAVTFSLASCDWLMLLEPMWFSTAWGVYNFAGMTQATLAAMVVLCLVLRSQGGPLHNVFTDDHLNDLGKLLLGFSCFWMYIWYSQYMLIWYANIPEETAYFIPRVHGSWGPIVILGIVLNWIVPFFVLLPRPCKRSGSVMMKVAVVVLIGRWVDLYLMVFPATIAATPAPDAQTQQGIWSQLSGAFLANGGFGIWQVAAVSCLVGAFVWLFRRAFSAANPIPRGDVLLGESLHYHC